MVQAIVFRFCFVELFLTETRLLVYLVGSLFFGLISSVSSVDVFRYYFIKEEEIPKWKEKSRMLTLLWLIISYTTRYTNLLGGSFTTKCLYNCQTPSCNLRLDSDLKLRLQLKLNRRIYGLSTNPDQLPNFGLLGFGSNPDYRI